MEKEWKVPAGTTTSDSPSTCADAEVEAVKTWPPPILMLTFSVTAQLFCADNGKLACAWGGSNVVMETTLNTVTVLFTTPRSEVRTHLSVVTLIEPVDSVSRVWKLSYVVPRRVLVFSRPTTSTRSVWLGLLASVSTQKLPDVQVGAFASARA